MNALAAGLVVLALAGPASACTLTLQPLPAPPGSGRVAAIALTLRHAALAVLHTPAGWQFLIDNDPSGTTRTTGHAIVGTAFLDPGDIATLFTIRPEPGYTCQALARSRAASLTLKLYRPDRFATLAVPSGTIRIADDLRPPPLPALR